MATRMDDAFAFVVAAPGNRGEDVLFEHGDFVGHRLRRRQPFHFGEEPRGAEGSATDHDGVHTVFVETFLRTFRRTYIAVSYDGYMHARVVLHFADQGPVRFAAVHLRPSATVDGEFLDAAILESFGEIHDKGCAIRQIEGGFIPSEARLAGDRCMDGIDDSTCDIKHFRDIPQESGACPLTRYFLDRAAEIDIDKVRMSGLDDPCRVRHRFGFTAVDLDGYGALFVMDRQLAGRRSDVPNKGIGVHKFRIDSIRSVTLAEHSEGRIGDILHRG